MFSPEDEVLEECRRMFADEPRLEQGLRLVLELRELVPTPEQQAVIDASTSLDELERWATRAKHTGSIAELLGA